MNLTPSQNNAVELFFQFLSDPSEHNFILRGGSGKGKTFTVAHLIAKMYKFFEMNRVLDDTYQEPMIHITATTNQAAERLHEATGQFTQTIHSLLCLMVKNDNSTGKTYLHRRDRGNFQKLNHSIIFIDEASMIDDELEQFINDSIDPKTTKVIRIGDPDQILAVDAFEPIGLQVETPYIAKLVEYCRAGELSPITLLGEKFRQAIYTGVIPDIESSNEIILIDGKTTKEVIDNYFLSPSQSITKCKVLTYTNETTQLYNQHIRCKFTSTDVLQPNEIVCTNGTVVNFASNKVQFRNNSYLKILDCVVTKDMIFNEYYEVFKITAVEVGDFNHESPETIYAFRYPKQLSYLLSKLYKSSNYRDYFEIKNRYADLRQTYSMTTDKSQGSTFENVIIDLNDMRKNKNISHLMRRAYVAVTRAKYKVFLRGSLKD